MLVRFYVEQAEVLAYERLLCVITRIDDIQKVNRKTIEIRS